MEHFTHVFSLIGVLLGLSLVEVLTGLSKVLKARGATKVGLLTPMLGTLVVLEVTSAWGIAWTLRDHLPDSVWQTLGAGVLLASAFYIAASSVLPVHPEQCENLDDYYWERKRQVLGIMIFCTVALYVIMYALGRSWTLLTAAINLPVLAGLLVAFLSRPRWLNVASLGFVIAVLLVNFSIP